MKNRSRRHHYLPKSYQANFSVDPDVPKVWVYDKKGGDPRPQHPVNTGVIRDLYTIQGEDGQPTDTIESELMAPIDDAAAPILKRLANGDAGISTEDVGNLSWYMAVMYVRSPRQMKVMEEVGVEVLLRILRRIGSDASEFRSAMEDFQKINPDSLAISQEDIFNIERDYKINLNREWQVIQALQQADLIRGLLLQMKCTIVHSRGEENFITCDSPLVVFEENSAGDAMFGGGLGRPGVEVSFPVGLKTSLLLSYQKGAKVSVWELNRRAAFMADRYVIAGEKCERIKELVNEAKWTLDNPKIDKDSLK